MFTIHAIIKKYKKSIIGVLVPLFLFAAGYYLGSLMQQNKYSDFLQGFKNIRENSDQYKFINPLIGGITAPATDIGLFSDVSKQVKKYLAKEIKAGNLYDYSFYVRDLNSGLWFGDRDHSGFFPASLFKLPIAIAAYKQGEDDFSFLKRRVIYTKELAEQNTLTQLNAESTLVVGGSYSVEELVEKMLTVSDNGAKDLLLSIMNLSYVDKLFSIVSLVDSVTPNGYEISSRKYALFLRVLYGSSYLNEEHSELLLEMLSKSSFKDGLVGGVPGNVRVAHKFGVYEVTETANQKEKTGQQLHDCGVVYHPEHPYIICLMTKGKNQEILFKIIANVSRVVYESQSNEDK